MRRTFARGVLTTSAIALGAALASNGASAQSFITQSIETAPVETTVTQTPTGTIVTRRLVAMQPSLAAPTVVETMPNTVDAITTHDVVRRRAAANTGRPMVTRQVSAHRANTKMVKRASTMQTTRRVQPRIVLSPTERQIVYQTIVEREVVPARPLITPAPRYAVPQYVEQVPPVQVQAPVMAADDDNEPTYTIGSVLPRNTPLFAMPQDVALRVPATQRYSYAWIGGRAYLVDPASGVVVSDISE